ncbi:MAG: dTMP kinase [Desulfobulbus propionicus]|nr:MAG: dTMP kinase [Desulfobulbus propionicus]
MSNCKGRLIVFEGIDGTGKTTQIRLLEELLCRKGHEVVATREPSDSVYGRRIRELYTNRKAISREEELRLFIEDRKQHVSECIQPALDRGSVVLTDRYYYSTAAYQGAAGADVDEIFAQNEFAPVPDIVLLLTMPVELSVQRIREVRGDKLDDFEQKEQLEKAAVLFSSFIRPEIVRINAADSIEVVHRRVRQAVQEKTFLLPVNQGLNS